MREEKDGVFCVFGFGKTSTDVLDNVRQLNLIPNGKFERLNNPQPTGDHWRVIGWVIAYKKRGEDSLKRVPQLRRDFIRKAASALNVSDGGFYMELLSNSAKTFKAMNDIHMERGRVFIFIGNMNLL